MACNIGWMYQEGDVEEVARMGAMSLLGYLKKEGLITEEVYDQYRYRITFQYKFPSWYSKAWKKFWPWADKDQHLLTLALLDLPEVKEETTTK